MSREFLTPKQVANAIGVSEASLKRWCDRGEFPTSRTAGGHRRIPLHGVMTFLRKHNHPLVRPELLGLPAVSGVGDHSLQRAADRIRDALEAGDGERVRGLITGLYLAGSSICELCDKVLGPIFETLGAKWQHGDLEIFQERLACEICHRVLFELGQYLTPVGLDSPYALGGTLSHDPYTLPTHMIELVLREAGWRAESYGIGHPVETFCAALRIKRPKIAWLSVSSIQGMTTFVKEWETLVETSRSLAIPLVVGGRALTSDIRANLEYTAYCDRLSHIISFANTMHHSVRSS